MRKWVKILILVVVVVLVLQFLIGALYCSATDFKPSGAPLKVAVVERPYNISVVFSDTNFTKAVVGKCGDYATAVARDVFGKNNPAIGKFLSCSVTGDGRVVYTFSISNDFIVKMNSTLIQSPIPLSGKFAIAVVKSEKITKGKSQFLYIYDGNTTQFVGDHTPRVVYHILPLYDPEKTFYVLPTDNGKAVIIFPDGFNKTAVEVSGDVIKGSGYGYTYYTGKPVKVLVKRPGIRVYFIYDKDCYSVKANTVGQIIVMKKKDSCNGVPVPVVSYYDGVKSIIVSYITQKELLKEIYGVILLCIITIALSIILFTFVRLEKEEDKTA